MKEWCELNDEPSAGKSKRESGSRQRRCTSSSNGRMPIWLIISP